MTKEFPVVGDEIYVPTFEDYGFMGGLASVSQVIIEAGAVVIKEWVYPVIIWEKLEPEQEKLKKIFGSQRAFLSPDYEERQKKLNSYCLSPQNHFQLGGSQMSGKVLHIFIASDAGEPMQEVPKVMAIEQLGLKGDRYTGERGKSGRQVIRHVSFIEQEVVDRVNRVNGTNFLPEDTRRNIVTLGISLNDLVGKEFMVWGVKMRGVELCDPCNLPSKLCGKSGFKKFFSGFGGLRAEILTSGPIYVGANINTVTYSCLICGTTTSYPHVCPEFYPELR